MAVHMAISFLSEGIGAALLMRVPTSFQIFGYPGLAIICFLAAAGGGLWLVKAVHMIPAPAGTGAQWTSFWASLTFELRNTVVAANLSPAQH